MIILIVCSILIVLLIVLIRKQHLNPHNIKKERLAVNSSLDNADMRAIFISEKTKPQIIKTLDADDLFTVALIYVHNLDDILDKMERTKGPIEKRKQIVAYNTTKKLAHEAIQRAIVQRTRENNTIARAVAPTQPPIQPIFHDDIIEMHANEMGVHHARIQQHQQQQQQQQQPIIVTQPPAKWAPDPENVHDSAIGGDVNAKLERMKSEDLHIMWPNTVIGNVIILAQERQLADDKRQKILITLEVASVNSHCSRYNIDELEALRLVVERAYHTANEEDKHNIEDAILNALCECVDASGKSTVCLVGRISRYVGALDIVDKGMPETLHSVDAYRNEILFTLGKMQREAGDVDVTQAQIDDLIDSYRDKIPQHVLEKIRAECKI